MPRSQSASERPISFVLHDTTSGASPVTVPLVIRPEELTRSEQSRITVVQTLGGAFADCFGQSVPTVTISGHTGWGAGDRPDGFDEFQKLHKTVFDEWHAKREAAAKAGKDPDGVKMIFADALDDFTWVVAPTSFILRRHKSRPLLSQYQIQLVKLADGVVPAKKTAVSQGVKDSLGLSSLDSAINTIKEFGNKIKGAISAALGPIKNAIQSFVKLTSTILGAVRTVISTVKGAINAVSAPLLEIAGLVSKAGRNIMGMAAAITSFPQEVRHAFMRTAAAYTNAFCLFSNAFKKRKVLPDYSSVYGASNCSSTSGGEPQSAYASSSANVFKDIFDRPNAPVAASRESLTSLNYLANVDIVRAPVGLSALAAPLKTVMSGIRMVV